MGLNSVREEAYLHSISGFRLFARVCGMSESMEGAKYMFLVGTTVVGTVKKF